MGLFYWVRIGVMILTLSATVYVMKKLRVSTASNEQSVNLCPTRVSSVSVIGRFAIIQEGMKWYRTGDAGGRTELDPVAVEKWFGQNCKLPSSPEGANEGASPLLTLAYVSGAPTTLMVNEAGVFTLGSAHFRSLELSQAITALEHLPPVTPPGTPPPGSSITTPGGKNQNPSNHPRVLQPEALPPAVLPPVRTKSGP